MPKAFVLYILCIVFFVPVLLFFHACVVRLASVLKKEVSQQALLLYCLFFFNIPILVVLYKLTAGRLLSIIYLVVIFNAIGYMYFHFFNMSETARRIKILVGIKKGVVQKEEDLKTYYDSDDSLSVRLERLEDLGQIEKKDEGYVMKKRLLWYPAFFMMLLRRILGF